MMNVYRSKYGIPEDLMVRKPDKEIRMTLQDSEAIAKVQKMAERSIHPSLIFFEKDLEDHLAMIAVQKLHSQDFKGKQKEATHLMHFKETNALLSGGNP